MTRLLSSASSETGTVRDWGGVLQSAGDSQGCPSRERHSHFQVESGGGRGHQVKLATWTTRQAVICMSHSNSAGTMSSVNYLILDTATSTTLRKGGRGLETAGQFRRGFAASVIGSAPPMCPASCTRSTTAACPFGPPATPWSRSGHLDRTTCPSTPP